MLPELVVLPPKQTKISRNLLNGPKIITVLANGVFPKLLLCKLSKLAKKFGH